VVAFQLSTHQRTRSGRPRHAHIPRYVRSASDTHHSTLEIDRLALPQQPSRVSVL
jgi:hypothetical protein